MPGIVRPQDVDYAMALALQSRLAAPRQARLVARASAADVPRLGRRAAVVGITLVPFIVAPRPRPVAAEPLAPNTVYTKFQGYNQAPDLYLGYGASSDAPPAYEFEYPVTWTEETPTKTDKSTMGMDGRVMHPTTRKEQAYVVALGGKDYRDSVLKDAKSSLVVFAGGDPDLRQALTDGEVQSSQKRINGIDMYVFDIASDKRHYLSSIGKKGDTVYALVVGAPKAAWEKEGEELQHIQDTFRLL